MSGNVIAGNSAVMMRDMMRERQTAVWRHKTPDETAEAYILTVADDGEKPNALSVALYYTRTDDPEMCMEETLSFVTIKPVTLEDMEAAAKAVANTDGQGNTVCVNCSGHKYVPARLFGVFHYGALCRYCKGEGFVSRNAQSTGA